MSTGDTQIYFIFNFALFFVDTHEMDFFAEGASKDSINSRLSRERVAGERERKDIGHCHMPFSYMCVGYPHHHRLTQLCLALVCSPIKSS